MSLTPGFLKEPLIGFWEIHRWFCMEFPDLLTSLLKLANSFFVFFSYFPSFCLFAWICRNACVGFWEVLYYFCNCFVHHTVYINHTWKHTDSGYFFPFLRCLFLFIVSSVFSPDFVSNAVIFTKVTSTGLQNVEIYLSVWSVYTLSYSWELHSFLLAGCLVVCRGWGGAILLSIEEGNKKKKESQHFSISNYSLFVWP